MAATSDRVIDLLDGELYAGDPYPTYAWMRDHAPVYWDAQNELWGIARYDDIVEIEKAKDVFISSDREKGGYRPNLPSDPSIIGLDDPLHTKRRKLVNRGFTPRTVLAWEDHIQATITGLLDAAATKDRVELIEDLAGPLPAQMIGLLLGYPHEMWPKLMEWSARTIVGGGGPRYADDDVIMAAFEFAGACAELYEEKQRCPADDIMTVWTTAEIDGEAIGLDPVISDCLLLLDGGAETTRTVIARTILELAARPDQYQLLRDGADMTVAIEEFIRWVTPVLNMCRVATRDYEIGGQTIRAGPAGRPHVPVGQPRSRALRRPRGLRRDPHARTTTSRSGSAPTSAWAPRWRASRSRCSSTSSCAGCATSGSCPAASTSCPTHS